MPASHLSFIHRNIAALIYAIINDIPVDISRVLNESIFYCIKDESIAFVYPSLITSLCKAAGVPWTANEPILHEKVMFDSKAFNFMKDRTSGFGTNEEFELPPSPPRRQTMAQKKGELEKMVKDHVADFATFKTQVLDMFVYQRQVHEVLHWSLVELSQKKNGIPVVLPLLPSFPIQPAANSK